MTTLILVTLGGVGGRGMLGGGAGGGKPIAGMLFLGATPFAIGCCICCLRTPTLGLLWRFEETALALLARLPGRNDGVLEMARTGRYDDMKGAGSERTCTDIGRRS